MYKFPKYVDKMFMIHVQDIININTLSSLKRKIVCQKPWEGMNKEYKLTVLCKLLLTLVSGLEIDNSDTVSEIGSKMKQKK